MRAAAVVALAALVLAGGGLFVHGAHARPPTPLTPEEQAVKDALRSLLQREDDAVAVGDGAALTPLFDVSGADGRAALRHAGARLAFVQAWAAARGVRWLPPAVSVRTPRIRFASGGSPRSVRVTAIVSEAWTYAYPDGQRQTFGLGREHHMVLTHDGGGWRIAADDFTDPLDQDTRIPGPATPGVGTGAGPSAAPAATPPRSPAARYDRAGAVRYADTYCGAAPGCGNGGRYNPSLYDYNGEGGDCTNFVSQALRFGGGLRETPAWSFDRDSGEGTDAWAKAPELVAYLTGSGLARILARGGFGSVSAAVASTLPGDLIAYSERGAIVHMAMVTARDPHGYVLVNSHTADRYHVPWDIGWDQSARFIVLRVTGGPAGAAAASAQPSAFVPLAAGCGAGG
jgi:hypothetical protein